LNASRSPATSASLPASSSRRPGAYGSTRRISAVSCSSGPNTRRISTRLTEIISTVPTARTTASASCNVGLTVAGDTASRIAAAMSTAALIATTRLNSVI
jgi:hypothetical protein